MHIFHPPFTLKRNFLQCVASFKYLGQTYVITCGNDDVNRKIRNMHVHENTLFQKFKNCSIPV